MPDLVTHHFWRCDAELRRQYASTSRRGVVYTATARGPHVHCTCPGFANHQKCWHAEEVWAEHCTWSEQWNGMGLDVVRPADGSAFRCPNCGGPVASFSDAV